MGHLYDPAALCPGLAQNTVGKGLGQVQDNLIVQERQRLRGSSGVMAAGTCFIAVGRIERAKQRITEIAFRKNIDAAAIPLLWVRANRPAATGYADFGRKLRIDAGSALLPIQLTADSDKRISESFSFEATGIPPAEPLILRGDLAIGSGTNARLAVRGARNHQAMHRLQAPAAFHELSGKLIEQFRVGGRLPLAAEITRSGYNSPPKMVLP